MKKILIIGFVTLALVVMFSIVYFENKNINQEITPNQLNEAQFRFIVNANYPNQTYEQRLEVERFIFLKKAGVI
jgi:hypothetical protein